MGRASFGVSRLSGAEKKKEETKTKEQNIAVSECKTLHRFCSFLYKVKSAKSDSDFAANKL